jgi:hypothetical protein
VIWDGADSDAKPLTLRQKLMKRREAMAHATEQVAEWREAHPDKVRERPLVVSRMPFLPRQVV